MKIVRLSTFLDFGGLEKRLVNISHVNDANEWIFLCLNKYGHAAEEIKKHGKKVINIDANPSIYSLRTTYKVYKFLKKEKPDILHTSGAEANFHGILAGRLARINKLVAEEIGIPSQSSKARFVYKQIYKMSNFVIGNSKPVLKVLKELNSVKEQKLVQVHNPVIFEDLGQYHFTFHPKSATHIISVSRLTKVKKIEDVISVISEFIKNGHDLYYHIYGEGEERFILNNLIKKLDLQDRILIHGFEPNPLEKHFAADIYILNSLTEGFSNALAEAMYTKTIVISTDSGSASEMITPNVSGFIIPVNDKLALKNQLYYVLNLDPKEVKKIGDSAHKQVISNYSLENHIKELYKIYGYNR